MKKSKLLIVLSIIFYCLAGTSAGAVQKISQEMYEKVITNLSAGGMLAQLHAFDGVEIDDTGAALSQGSKTIVLRYAARGKSYAQYVAGVDKKNASSTSAPPPPPGSAGHAAPPPPPPPPGAETATAPKDKKLGGEPPVTVVFIGKTAAQIVAMIKDLPSRTQDRVKTFHVKNIQPQSVQDAVRAGLGMKKKRSGSRSSSTRPRPASRPKAPTSFGTRWLKEPDKKGATKGDVITSAASTWTDSVNMVVSRITLDFIVAKGGPAAGKCKLIGVGETVDGVAQAIIAKLNAENVYPAPMEAFDQAWSIIFPEGDDTVAIPVGVRYAIRGKEIYDRSNIGPLKEALLKRYAGMAFVAAASSSGGSSSHSGGGGGGGSTVQLPAAWLQQAAQWFVTKGRKVDITWMGVCIKEVGAPAGFTRQASGGFDKDGQGVSVSEIMKQVSAAKANLGSSSSSTGQGQGGSQGAAANKVTITQAQYEKAVVNIAKAPGPFKNIAANQTAKTYASGDAATKGLKDALVAGMSFADFKAAHADWFGQSSSGQAAPPPPPPPSHGHTSPPPPPSGHAAPPPVSIPADQIPTEVEYNKYKRMANVRVPNHAIATQVRKDHSALSLNQSDKVVEAVKAAASYADFKAALLGEGSTSGGQAAPPPPPPPSHGHTPPPPPPPPSGNTGDAASSAADKAAQQELMRLNQTLQMVPVAA